MLKTETIYGCKFMQGETGCSYEGEPAPSGLTPKGTCLCVKTNDQMNPGYAGNCDVGRENIVEEKIPQS